MRKHISQSIKALLGLWPQLIHPGLAGRAGADYAILVTTDHSRRWKGLGVLTLQGSLSESELFFGTLTLESATCTLTKVAKRSADNTEGTASGSPRQTQAVEEAVWGGSRLQAADSQPGACRELRRAKQDLLSALRSSSSGGSSKQSDSSAALGLCLIFCC